MYTFTCPLEGCDMTMKSDQTDRELAAAELVAAAQTHLQQVHPTVVKSHEEVDADIHEHMVVVGSGPAV